MRMQIQIQSRKEIQKTKVERDNCGRHKERVVNFRAEQIKIQIEIKIRMQIQMKIQIQIQIQLQLQIQSKEEIQKQKWSVLIAAGTRKGLSA